MARAWVVWTVIVIGACFEPSRARQCEVRCVANGPCPDGLSCLAGFCTAGATCGDDGGVIPGTDGPAMDAAVPCTIPTTWTQLTDLALGALNSEVASYTTDAARATAVFELGSSGNGTTESQFGPVDSLTLARLVPNDTIARYRAPHINPEGDEVYLQVAQTAGGVDFGSSTRATPAAAWGGASILTVVDAGANPMTFGESDVPGTLTLRGVAPNRRMMIKYGSANFVELEEVSDRRWQATQVYALSDFIDNSQALIFIDDPQLSPDGLRLVFNGQAAGGNNVVRGTQRGSLDVRFPATSTILHTSGYSMSHPFLSADCKRLYVYNNNGVVVRLHSP